MKKLIDRIFGITEYSHLFTPKNGRTEKQICYDAALKMQKQLVESGALKIKYLPGGKIKVTLKVKK